METAKVDEYMERIRNFKESENHLTKEGLDKIWPNLSEDQQEHLNYCSSCQKLVEDGFPVLYVGPVHDIIYKEKSSNKASEYILEELESRFKSGCFDIFAGSLFLSSITRKNINHVQGCKTCRRLINYLSRSGGGFAKGFGGLHQSFLALVDMNLEIWESMIACRGGSGNIEARILLVVSGLTFSVTSWHFGNWYQRVLLSVISRHSSETQEGQSVTSFLLGDSTLAEMARLPQGIPGLSGG